MIFIILFLLLLPATLHATPDQTSMSSDYKQTIQLEKGWNLVSFNINDDPDPISNPWIMQEIFGGQQWFAQATDRVYRYSSEVDNYPNFTGSETWPWVMEHAYLINLHAAHALALADEDWYSEDDLTFTPDEAWADSMMETLPDEFNVPYWFFLGFSKSRQVQVLPANEQNGPFWDIYGHNQITDNTLLVVKADDGSVFLPNYGGTSHDIDKIGFLEPGRGYALGFLTDDIVEDWPFCSGISEEQVDPGSTQKEGSKASIASGDSLVDPVPVHFQFKSRTQWWYPVVIDTIGIEDLTPESGDEIAIFDADLCVGAAGFAGEYPLVIAAWKDDIATPEVTDGYEAGNEMIFKFFDRSENTEIIFELPPTTMTVKEEVPYAPRQGKFGQGCYARRSLTDGIAQIVQLPKEFKIGQNYPNPFNAETVIPVILPERSRITVYLYDLLGRRVCQVYNGVQNAGNGRIHFNASNLSSGVYFYHVEAEGQERGAKFSDIGKMLLLK